MLSCGEWGTVIEDSGLDAQVSVDNLTLDRGSARGEGNQRSGGGLRCLDGARASLDGFSAEGEDTTAEPFFGYYFRMLNAQGDAAPGGAMEYMVGDNQLAGHALLAVPAIYGETGVHSFLVAENGVLFQADLGEDTLETALGITTYNPDGAWTTVE